MSDTSEQMRQISAGMDFVKDVIIGINDHFDNNKVMSLTDYQFIVAKAKHTYESRAKNRPSTTGDSA